MTTVTLNIPEGVKGREAIIEAACRLFDAQQITKSEACRMCGLSRVDFESALMDRGLPLIRYTQDMLDEDLKALEKMRRHNGTAEPGS